MPIVRIEMLSGRTAEQKKELAFTISSELSRIAQCEMSDVQIIFSDVERHAWAIGGKLLGPAQNAPSLDGHHDG
jgi:4-oxalocrotonate tautomerase